MGSVGSIRSMEKGDGDKQIFNKHHSAQLTSGFFMLGPQWWVLMSPLTPLNISDVLRLLGYLCEVMKESSLGVISVSETEGM